MNAEFQEMAKGVAGQLEKWDLAPAGGIRVEVLVSMAHMDIAIKSHPLLSTPRPSTSWDAQSRLKNLLKYM